MTPRRLRLLLCCAALAAGSAAAQGDENECLPLAAADAAKVRTVRVTSAIPQDDVQKMTLPLIQAQVQPPAGVSFGAGLIFSVVASVVVTSVINADVQKRIEQATLAFPPLLEQVRDFDFRREFWGRLADSLEREPRFAVLDITTFDAERGYVEQHDTVRGEPVDALLDLRTEYALSPDLRSFVMVTHARLQARADARELYRCRYHFSTPPVAAGDYAGAIAAWAADGGALYRAAAVIGMRQTLKMLAYDLTGEGAPRPAIAGHAHTQETIASLGGTVRVATAAALVEREDGAVIVRDAKGFMRSSVEGETFSPSEEVVAAAASAAAPPRPRGPIALEDLLGVMDEAPAAARPPPGAAPEKSAESAPAPGAAPDKEPEGAPPVAKPARAVQLDDLEGLLGR